MKSWGIFERFERDYINYFLNFSLWHLITLTGSAYFQLFDKLKNSWFKKELGGEHEPDFYYNQSHYHTYTQMMKMSAEEFLFYLKQQAERKASDLEWHNHNLHRSLDIERQKIHRLEDENKANLSRVHDLEKEIADIKGSTAWKIGTATTAIPHQIKTLLGGNK